MLRNTHDRIKLVSAGVRGARIVAVTPETTVVQGEKDIKEPVSANVSVKKQQAKKNCGGTEEV